MIRLVLITLLLLFLLTFFLQNQEQEVTLRYLFGLQETSTYLYIPVLSAFGVGVLVASILLLPAWIRGRLELRRKARALDEAEANLERVRRSLDGAKRRPVRAGADELDEDLYDE